MLLLKGILVFLPLVPDLIVVEVPGRHLELVVLGVGSLLVVLNTRGARVQARCQHLRPSFLLQLQPLTITLARKQPTKANLGRVDLLHLRHGEALQHLLLGWWLCSPERGECAIYFNGLPMISLFFFFLPTCVAARTPTLPAAPRRSRPTSRWAPSRRRPRRCLRCCTTAWAAACRAAAGPATRSNCSRKDPE